MGSKTICMVRFSVGMTSMEGIRGTLEGVLRMRCSYGAGFGGPANLTKHDLSLLLGFLGDLLGLVGLLLDLFILLVTLPLVFGGPLAAATGGLDARA